MLPPSRGQRLKSDHKVRPPHERSYQIDMQKRILARYDKYLKK